MGRNADWLKKPLIWPKMQLLIPPLLSLVHLVHLHQPRRGINWVCQARIGIFKFCVLSRWGKWVISNLAYLHLVSVQIDQIWSEYLAKGREELNFCSSCSYFWLICTRHFFILIKLFSVNIKKPFCQCESRKICLWPFYCIL